jgi:hypothetical protein
LDYWCDWRIARLGHTLDAHRLWQSTPSTHRSLIFPNALNMSKHNISVVVTPAAYPIHRKIARRSSCKADYLPTRYKYALLPGPIYTTCTFFMWHSMQASFVRLRLKKCSCSFTPRFHRSILHATKHYEMRYIVQIRVPTFVVIIF